MSIESFAEYAPLLMLVLAQAKNDQLEELVQSEESFSPMCACIAASVDRLGAAPSSQM